ncbi:hypothetical protein A7A78_14075 [Aequorivita soesokkakensis]|uniref:Uncharacterized protein n=1 Tax=Aequorivita soesokkakensis TaxID=1385699 RepID=A0A1A9LDQ9_9FLAO|nr:hypothetical protein A7A78_14075 [Aequorivita soesokkakensis]
MFKIIRAAITPGTHPQTVSMKTINTDPQPLPITASGGKRIASRTLHILIENKSTINIFDFLLPISHFKLRISIFRN